MPMFVHTWTMFASCCRRSCPATNHLQEQKNARQWMFLKGPFQKNKGCASMKRRCYLFSSGAFRQPELGYQDLMASTGWKLPRGQQLRIWRFLHLLHDTLLIQCERLAINSCVKTEGRNQIGEKKLLLQKIIDKKCQKGVNSNNCWTPGPQAARGICQHQHRWLLAGPGRSGSSEAGQRIEQMWPSDKVLSQILWRLLHVSLFLHLFILLLLPL